MIERSFAEATNFHGFKQARWRGLGRQRIQDFLIAAIQNIRILISKGHVPKNAESAALKEPNFDRSIRLRFLLLPISS